MSRAYYNEFDPKTAAWLRELIKRDLIAPGDVDERSITEVQPEDIKGYAQVHLFAGIGGWSYALRLAGWPDDRPVWTGSCPCQPFSVAGNKQGVKDQRHLWPEMRRLISECNPSVVFGEQTSSKAGRGWLSGVRTDLEALGYAVGGSDLCAAGVGAPHIRQRLYWVADANGAGRRKSGRSCPDGTEQPADQRSGEDRTNVGSVPVLRGLLVQSAWDSYSGLFVPEHRRVGRGGPIYEPAKQLRVGAGVAWVADGVPAYVVRGRGYGNAIVPPLAAAFIQAYEGSVN